MAYVYNHKTTPGSTGADKCEVEPGTVAQHVSLNTTLDGDDWATVGQVAMLEMLNVGCCYMQPEMFFKHLARLNCSMAGYHG